MEIEEMADRSSSEQKQDNETAQLQQINTGGGVAIDGNVTIEKGDFIGRDKNIFIGSVKIPRWLLVVVAISAIVVIIVAIYISNYSRTTSNTTSAVATRIFEPTPAPPPTPTETPLVMEDDAFGIAISALNAINLRGESVNPEFASGISDSIASYMREQAGELRDITIQSVAVWGPAMVEQTVTEATAPEIAVDLNTDVLVYGTLRQIDNKRWTLKPAFYLSEKAVQKSVSLGGEYPLGNEISYRPDSISSIRDINAALHVRLKALTQIFLGVSYIAKDDLEGYQQATQVFEQAINDLESLTTDDVGQEVIYHFLGSAYFLWSTLLNDDSKDRSEILEKARIAYENALTVNPQFIRANNGLGSTLFQISRPLIGEENQDDPCNWKWTEFDASKQQYQVALEADSNLKPPSGHVDYYSHFGLGRFYFYQGLCRNNGDLEVALAAWQEARDNYEIVLEEYSTFEDPLPVLQDVAAYANADLGQIALVHWDYLNQTSNLDKTQAVQLLSSATDYLANAVTLDIQSGTEPGRKHAISTMPNYLTALCMQGKSTKIQSILDDFLVNIQGSIEIKQSIIDRVVPSWEDCTNGEK